MSVYRDCALVHLILYCRFNHILDLEGTLLPLFCLGQIAAPPASIQYIALFGSYLLAILMMICIIVPTYDIIYDIICTFHI